MNQSDLRVIKTEKNIEESFLRLLTENSFSELTVQMLLDEALINRSTFYKHYADKYELAERLCSRHFQEFQTIAEGRFSTSRISEILEIIEFLYEFLYERRAALLPLWNIRTETIHLYDDMASYLKNRFTSSYASLLSGGEAETDYLSTVYASLVMSSLQWCLNHDYSDVREAARPFIHHILLALQETISLQKSV